MNDIQVSENFKLREFECRCCQAVKLDSELLRRLQAIRTEAGRPVVISSGYRCPSHNRSVGGAAQSRHMVGDAADFRITGLPISQQRQLAEKYFDGGGIGYGSNFTHVDTRGTRARWNY